MIKASKPILLILSIVLHGCDSGVLWKDEPYIVHWIDTHDNITLDYDIGKGGSIGRVEATVVEVGSNKHYVVAKRCTDNDCNYYYIQRAKDHRFARQDEALFGPFTYREFQNKTKALRLPPLDKKLKH